MRTISWPTPYGYTVFCDDIRQEMNHKTMILGIYSGDIIVNDEPPTLMEKLVFSVSYFEKPGESDEPLQLLIFSPGDADDAPSVRLDMPSDWRHETKLVDQDADDPRIGFTMVLTMAPFKIAQTGYLKVRMVRGDTMVRLGSIRVTTRALYDARTAVPSVSELSKRKTGPRIDPT